ncbi:hypothetical protein [Nocardioides jiangxiensis]|uniref:Uncharacterized protein n=1 Tax=Nocardioides jiangxiensis TaxID=3064524 RepID=A0ABT9B4D7_9ACTN|nr:hypothetical protein [Nocardioides sp. WY-20]MDO7869250.1 hypothetical protein [Nocardioides sp. WY-20]
MVALETRFGLASVLATVVAPVGLAVGAATPAQAYPIICDPGSSWTSVGTPSRVNQVTHEVIKENYTGSSATRTYSASRVSTIEASVSTSYTVSAEVSASIFKAFAAKVSSTLNATVAAKGSTTKTTAESVTWTMKSGDTYVFYAGSRKVTATWARKRCNSNGTVISTVATGTAKSFYNTVEGGVGCKQDPPAGTMAYTARHKYC